MVVVRLVNVRIRYSSVTVLWGCAAITVCFWFRSAAFTVWLSYCLLRHVYGTVRLLCCMFTLRLQCAFGTVTLRLRRIYASFAVRCGFAAISSAVVTVRCTVSCYYMVLQLVFSIVHCGRVDTNASKARRDGAGSRGDEKECAIGAATGPSLSPLTLS